MIRTKCNRKRNMESELEEEREIEEEGNAREGAGSTWLLNIDMLKSGDGRSTDLLVSS